MTRNRHFFNLFMYIAQNLNDIMTANKTNARHDPNMSAEDIQELKAKFQKLAATAKELYAHT